MSNVVKSHKHAHRIFNLIAPIYHLVDPLVRIWYKKASVKLDKNIPLQGKSILDIGSGTGAWGALLQQRGAEKVHGVDIAELMVRGAKRRYRGKLTFSLVDGENFDEFEEGAFDLITASYVMHGMLRDSRRKMLEEMNRLAKDAVIIHDFHGEQPAFARFLEYMEKSDYINFKKTFCEEMQEIFPQIYKLSIDKSDAIYIGFKSKERTLEESQYLTKC